MTKRKAKRPNIPEQTLARARAEMNGTAPAIATPPKAEKKNGTDNVRKTNNYVPSNRKSQPITTVTIDDLKQEYVYVISDLRSMAILAGVLSIAMVVGALIFV